MIRQGFESPVKAHWTEGYTKEGWYDSNPPFRRYRIPGSTRDSVHTGIDLQRAGNADAGQPVYAIADGFVTYAARGRGTWGNLVVIQHTPALHSRYAHLAEMRVRAGQMVQRGEFIGTVGKTGLEYVPRGEHLHFDVSHSGILAINPQHWPGNNLSVCVQHYLHPTRYLQSDANLFIVTAHPALRIRSAPSFSASVVGFLPHSALVAALEQHGDWARIAESGWVFAQWLFR